MTVDKPQDANTACAPSSSSAPPISRHPQQQPPRQTFRDVLERRGRPEQAPGGAARPIPKPRPSPRAGVAAAPRGTPQQRPVSGARAASERARAIGRLGAHAARSRADRAAAANLARSAAVGAKVREVLERAHATSAHASRDGEASRLVSSIARDLARDASATRAAVDSGRRSQSDLDRGGTPAASERARAESAPGPFATAAAAPATPTATGSDAGFPAETMPQPSASQRAEAIAALVARIESAMKSGRPELTLDLGGAAAAERIAIERTGRGEVAVRIDARANRRDDVREGLAELGQALEARGLRLRVLEVRRG